MRPLIAVSLLALAAGAVSAAPAPRESWGKAGISLAQYRQDALDCAVEGYNLDISRTEDAQAFVRASRELDNVPAPQANQGLGTGSPAGSSVDAMMDFANIQGHIVDNLHPQQRFRSIKEMQLARIDRCLLQRGYSKFRLTDEQRHRLGKLKLGSEQRRQYLYSLANNAAILEEQKAPAQP